MKIYCSKNRSNLAKIVGTDIWFKFTFPTYPHETVWINIRAVVRDRIFACYKVSDTAIERSADTLASRSSLFHWIHSTGASPFRVNSYKELFEIQLEKGEYLTTEELWGYTEDEMEAYALNQSADAD